MPGLIEVIDGRFGNSIQDLGRFGLRHMGVAVSGCLDTTLARCANALVGNDADCACIEIRALGPKLKVKSGRVRVALAGEVSATLMRVDGRTQTFPAWTSVTLDAQDRLSIGSLKGGCAYLAVSGGIESPVQLGSRSTYQRAKIGGIDGQPLVTGNLLPCKALAHRDDHQNKAQPWVHGETPIRVMLGPQEGHFKLGSVADLLNSDYAVTAQMDRMGMRLEGVPLAHLTPESADIVSDGVTPGAIQVPGNGQPIILLADCQTVGGYPKIATVISADMPRLGQLKPGQILHFVAVSAEQAKQALLEKEARITAWVAAIAPYRPDAVTACDDDAIIWTCNW